MDAEEISALAAGLGKALADGLAANEVAGEKRARAAEEDKAESAAARRIAARTSKAKQAVVDSFKADQDLRAQEVARAVARCCDKIRGNVIDSLKGDPRMPRTINYLERYSALVGMQDRGSVLSRIGSTLDLADKILDAVGRIDAQGAIAEAADRYAEGVLRLDGIVVSAPDLQQGAAEGSEAPRSESRADGMPDIAAAIGNAFADALDGMSYLEVELSERMEDEQAHERDIEQQIAAATAAAAQAAEGICRKRAAAVAGAVFTIEPPGAFNGIVACKVAKDPELVRELSGEVRTSFATFGEVVNDNGLFAAFSGEGSYGACRGEHFEWWWDDLVYDEYEGEIPGRRAYDDIPTSVEEDEGGDALERAIGRMRAFNERRYGGLLDDDFQQFVDAFWYGFKKLMVNVNGLFEIDARAFGSYCRQISTSAQTRAAALGARMDAHQAREFCGAVGKRAS